MISWISSHLAFFALPPKLPSASNTVAGIGGRYDLFSGFPQASGAAQIADNGDCYWYGSGLRGAFRGGDWANGSSDGRWSLFVNHAPTITGGDLGGRCRR